MTDTMHCKIHGLRKIPIIYNLPNASGTIFYKEGRKSYPSNALFKVFSKTGGRGDLFVLRNILVIF